MDNLTTPEAISSDKLFKKYLTIEVPRWALLDPVTQFVSARVLNTTGWTGNVEDMVIFHFLHGDSEINKNHEAHGWNVKHGGFVTVANKSILDIFYNQSDERLYRTNARPYALNEEVREERNGNRDWIKTIRQGPPLVLTYHPSVPRLRADFLTGSLKQSCGVLL